MSDAAPHLPPAAFEITESRRAVEHAAQAVTTVPLWLAIGLTAALVAAVVVSNLDTGLSIALIVAGSGVLLALLVVLPQQVATARRRRRVADAAGSLALAADGLVAHLAEVGYSVPAEVAAEWVTAPDTSAIVPLVHDSTIAARWWQPGPGDGRVFVEPFLRQESGDSALPVLPPLD